MSSIKTIFAEPIVQNFFDQTVTALIRKLKPIFDAEFEVILCWITQNLPLDPSIQIDGADLLWRGNHAAGVINKF